MQLYLIRHGEIAGDPHAHYTSDDLLEGCLSPRGCRQARALGEALSNVEFDHVFASPLGRALQTSQALRRRPGTSIVVEPWLIEWRPATIIDGCDDTRYEEMAARASLLRPEQSWKTEAGEGTLEMAHRVITGFLKTMADLGVQAGHGGYLLDDPDDERTIAMVAHGGSLGTLTGFLLGVPIRPYGPIGMAQTGVARFSFTRRVDVWYPTLHIPTPYPPSALEDEQAEMSARREEG